MVLREEVAEWLGELSEGDYQQVLAALDALAVDGPALGRPFVDTVKGSRHANMKELRPRGGNLRLLFAFDTERLCIVLVAGDKTNNWTKWYRANVRSPMSDSKNTLSTVPRRYGRDEDVEQAEDCHPEADAHATADR